MTAGERGYAASLDQESPVKGFVRRVWSHLGLASSLLVAAILVTLFVNLSTRPEYEAGVQLLIASSAPKAVNVEKVVEEQLETDTYLRTQIQLIRSRQLAERVISSLNLRDHPEFRAKDSGSEAGRLLQWYRDGKARVQGWISNLFQEAVGSAPVSPSEDRPPSTVDAFLARLNVRTVRGTRIVMVSYRGFDPAAVADIANEIAEQYVKWNLELEFSSTRRAAKWLEGQLAELKDEVEKSEQALQAYLQRENLMGVDMAESPEVVRSALGTLSQEIIKARSERIAAESAFRQFQDYAAFGNGRIDRLDDIPAGLLGGDTLINQFQLDLAEAQREYANLSRRYKPKHPVLVQLESKIGFLKKRLSTEISQAVKKLETRYVVAKSREDSLLRNLEQEKARVIRLGGKSVKLGVLRREVESNRKLYELFLGRIKETQFTNNLGMTNIQLVDKAVVPKEPVRPRKMRNLILGVVLGLFLGVGAAFGVEKLDSSLRDPDEVEHILEAPVLATIDYVSGLGKKEILAGRRNGKGTYQLEDMFNYLRTNILYSAPVDRHQLLLVTSSTPAEGKTFIAVNLAFNLANLGEDVLLIDADLRKPRIHKICGLSREHGLSDILVGRASEEKVFHRTDYKHLFVLPAGHPSPNPVELLGSSRMEQLLADSRQRFRYIVVDTPPVLNVSDALVLVPSMDGLLVAVWAGKTPRRHVGRSVKILRDVRNRKAFIGVAMNRIKRNRSNKYYYYHHYYSDYD